MAGAPHLIDPPPAAAQPRPAGGTPAARRTLVSARWRVHDPQPGEAIAWCSVAGADLELIEGSGPSRERLAEAGLALILWIQRGDEPQRTVLAAYAQNPARLAADCPFQPEAALFDLARSADAVNLVVSNGHPLLRLTQVQRGARRPAMLWCRGCIHELLGLGGGQYRLEDVQLDLPLVTDAALRAAGAGEAD